MSSFRFYLSIFLRWLPWFVLIAGVISGIAIAVAMTLPPSYVSQARLLVESQQIPGDLAQTTVQQAAEETLQIFETRLLTRANLLMIARKHNVLDDQAGMSPDDIVTAMQARTRIKRSSGRNEATLMTISFEAPSPQKAAAVVGEYLTLILQEDSTFRTERATQTQQFFEQEVSRLSEQLSAQSAKILEFKGQHADALPENLEYRRGQQISYQEQAARVQRDLVTLREGRDRLVKVFETTGRLEGGAGGLSPEEQRLQNAKSALAQALTVYADGHPKIRQLRAQIAVLEKEALATSDSTSGETDPARALLNVQLAEIDSKIEDLTSEEAAIGAQLAKLDESIAATPANALAAEALQRDYNNLSAQYDLAVSRLATASTGERIELLSRGQRVTVIEQPAIPSVPTKPNRLRLAIMGVGAGIGAGIGMIVLLELLNGTARRPVDLVNRLGITPIATIPYLQTRRQRRRHRAALMGIILLIMVAIPAGLFAIHQYYKPLDLIAEKVMNKLGIRGN